MKNEEISLQTKQTLSNALKAAMEKKPLSKITVSELIRTCNMNRNTFYYHFDDLYDLLKWTLEQETLEVVDKIDLLLNTEEAVRYVLDYVEQNRHIINCAYDTVGHTQMKRFFYEDFLVIMSRAIDAGERELGLQVDREFKQFAAAFFTEALAGMLITWLKDGKRQDREGLIQNVLLTCRTALPAMLCSRAQQLQQGGADGAVS